MTRQLAPVIGNRGVDRLRTSVCRAPVKSRKHEGMCKNRYAWSNSTTSGALRTPCRAKCASTSGMRAAYASDASNYRQVPIGVVLPRTVEDVVETMRVCSSARRAGARARRRDLAQRPGGQRRGRHRLLEVPRPRAFDRRAARLARVEPGVVCDTLRDAAEAHGLTFAPDPATHSRCTLGGMIGNNSCGPHSVMAGTTVREHRAPRGADLRRRAVLWCGPTSDAELRASLSGADDRPRSTQS